MPQSHEDHRLVFEGYPAGMAIDDNTPDRVALYLVDLPGCGVQAPDLRTAMTKMNALVPQFLDQLRASDLELPEPSEEALAVMGGIRWQKSAPMKSVTLTDERDAQAFETMAVPV